MKKVIEKLNKKTLITSLFFIFILFFMKNTCYSQQYRFLNVNFLPDGCIIPSVAYPLGTNFIGGDEPWENSFDFDYGQNFIGGDEPWENSFGFGYGQNFIGGDEPWENRFGQMNTWLGDFYLMGYEMSNWDTIPYTNIGR